MLILIKSQTRRERSKISQGGAQRNPGNAAWSNIPPWRGGTKPNRGLNPCACDSQGELPNKCADLIRTLGRLIGKGPQQLGLGLEEVVGRAQNKPPASACLLEAPPDFRPRCLLIATGKEVQLVETANHAGPPGNACMRSEER